MKHLFFVIIFFASYITTAQTIAAPIYRSVDPEGNVIFSDQPSPDSEQVEVEVTNIVPPDNPAVSKLKSGEGEPPFKYEVLRITKPENDTTLRNTGEISVSARSIPTLQRQHLVRFTDNGQALADPAHNLSIRLKDLERGSHQFQAQIMDEKGKILIHSETVTVHIHKTTIQQQQSKPKPKPKPKNKSN